MCKPRWKYQKVNNNNDSTFLRLSVDGIIFAWVETFSIFTETRNKCIEIKQL